MKCLQMTAQDAHRGIAAFLDTRGHELQLVSRVLSRREGEEEESGIY